MVTLRGGYTGGWLHWWVVTLVGGYTGGWLHWWVVTLGVVTLGVVTPSVGVSYLSVRWRRGFAQTLSAASHTRGGPGPTDPPTESPPSSASSDTSTRHSVTITHLLYTLVAVSP